MVDVIIIHEQGQSTQTNRHKMSKFEKLHVICSQHNNYQKCTLFFSERNTTVKVQLQSDNQVENCAAVTVEFH